MHDGRLDSPVAGFFWWITMRPVLVNRQWDHCTKADDSRKVSL